VLRCLRCNVNLEFVGARVIDYKTVVPRSLAEVFNIGEDVDVFRCPNCGHIEDFDVRFGHGANCLP